MKKKVFVISHTHWDREWYLRRETFLMMLVELVDSLLEIFKKNPDYHVFMLDGQTIVLEDYLSVRPEREQELQHLIRAGRILIGPWYVMPDEYLISGEGHIRNYLAGSRICERMGANMNVGYLPDSFGHPSQIPQILKGLGLKQIIFWRGLGVDVTETELQWFGLDGTMIQGINMPYGYGMAACLPTKEDSFVERMTSIIDRLEPLTRTNSILVMQGVDHVAPLEDVPRLLEIARKRLPDYEFIHGSLADYLESLPKGESYQRTFGELRSGYKAYLLGGTISTRMYLKQVNFQSERELISYAEPLQAMAAIFGGENYRTDILAHAWKIYLQNMPHDSICGCSIDDVHTDMMVRYKDLAAVNNHLVDSGFSGLVPYLKWPNTSGDGDIVVFNPLLSKRAETTVVIELVYEKHLIRKVNYSNSVLEENYPKFKKDDPTGINVWTTTGKELSGRIIDISVTDEAMDLSLEKQPEMFLEKRILVELPVEDIPSVGLATLSYRWLYEEADSDIGDGYRIENDTVIVTVDPEKANILILDKRTGTSDPIALSFVDSGDAGDEYTYSAPERNQKIDWTVKDVHAKSLQLGSSMVIEGYLDLPSCVTEDRKSRSEELCRCPLTVTIFLAEHACKAEFNVAFENLAKDHHLTVELDTRQHSSHSFAESLFGIDERSISEHGSEQYDDWVEAPSTYAHKTFVAVPYNRGTVCLANRGIPAFEAINTSEGSTVIALTLLRSVGWLSRYDLRARKGNGGWSLRTPDAQCLGKHNFEFAVIIDEQGVDLGRVAQAAHAYAYPVIGRQVERPILGKVAGISNISLISIDSTAVVLSAIKLAENGQGWVFRFYNTTSDIIRPILTFTNPLKYIEVLDLKEDPISSKIGIVDDKSLEVEFEPWQIKTLQVVFRSNA